MPKARFAPRSVLAFLFWSLVASLVPLSLAAQPRVPSTVSPGAHDRFDAVGDRCPTFSWSVVPGAVGYELALYALSDAVSEPSNGSPIEAPLARSLPILEHSIDAPATSWTPSLERCLHAVGSFGWAVRGRLASGAATDWSEPRLFELSDSARETDLEETLDLLERRLAADPSLADGLIDRLADRLADRLTDRVLDNVGWPVRQERSPAPRQVLTGTSEARPRPDQASADAIAGVPSSALAAGSIRIAGDSGSLLQDPERSSSERRTSYLSRMLVATPSRLTMGPCGSPRDPIPSLETSWRRYECPKMPRSRLSNANTKTRT